jgi:hypothetical protein
MVQLELRGGVKMTHVPYKGGAPALADVMGGHVPLYFSGINSVLPHLKTNRLRAIAVSSATRSKALPGVPAVAYFPLVDDEVPSGVLEIHSESALSPDDVRLVSSILRVYRNFKALIDYSERDTLTGLVTRPALEAALDQAALACNVDLLSCLEPLRSITFE